MPWLGHKDEKLKQDDVLASHRKFANRGQAGHRTDKPHIPNTELAHKSPSNNHHIQVRLRSLTHNGGLSHIRYAFCCVQARLSSHSSMSKCHIIRVKIDRISKYARLNWQRSSARQAPLLLECLRTYFLPMQFRGPTEKGWSASLRSLR